MAKSQDQTILRLTNAETHHFFILNPAQNDAAEDEDGYVMVFLARSAAEDILKTLQKSGEPLVVIGMGDAKWEAFQKEVPHRIVPLAAA